MDKVKVGQRIKAARLARGLSLREAARLIVDEDGNQCLTHQMLAFIEKGQNTTLDTLQRVASAVGLTYDVLVSEEQPVAADDPDAALRAAVLARLQLVLPRIPLDEIEVFMGQIGLWERRFPPTTP